MGKSQMPRGHNSDKQSTLEEPEDHAINLETRAEVYTIRFSHSILTHKRRSYRDRVDVLVML